MRTKIQGQKSSFWSLIIRDKIFSLSKLLTLKTEDISNSFFVETNSEYNDQGVSFFLRDRQIILKLAPSEIRGDHLKTSKKR